MSDDNPNNTMITPGKRESLNHEQVVHDAKSMGAIIFGQFIEHRMALIGLITIILFILLALAAPLISKITGLDPTTQNVFKRYMPPMSTVVSPKDTQEEHLEKKIMSDKRWASTLTQQLRAAKLIKSGVADEDALFEFLASYQNKSIRQQARGLKTKEIDAFHQLWQTFHSLHILGTDELGRDFLMRLLFGTRISISVGLLVAFASMLIGLILGSMAGYYGGWVDMILSRFIDALLSLPLLPLMIVLAAVDFSQFSVFKWVADGESQSVVKLVLILCLFSWMRVARLVRGSILSLREREFILAAQTLGAKDITIIISHVIPNVIAPLLVAVTLNVGEGILSEAGLSFLGLGIQPPTPSWGNILFNAIEQLHNSPLLAIAPGILILITVVSFNFVGDGLQDAIDPKAIKR